MLPMFGYTVISESDEIEQSSVSTLLCCCRLAAVAAVTANSCDSAELSAEKRLCYLVSPIVMLSGCQKAKIKLRNLSTE